MKHGYKTKTGAQRYSHRPCTGTGWAPGTFLEIPGTGFVAIYWRWSRGDFIDAVIYGRGSHVLSSGVDGVKAYLERNGLL